MLGVEARSPSWTNRHVAETCESDLPEHTHLPTSQDVRAARAGPWILTQPPASPPHSSQTNPNKRRGHTKCPPPITLSVETLPSRPGLAMAPPGGVPASPSCSILTGVWPAGTFCSSQRRQALPCLGAFAPAVPLPGPLFHVLQLSPLHAITTPGSLLNATFRGGPHRSRLPPHSIPNPSLSTLAAPTRRAPLRVPRAFPVLPAAHVGAQAL